MLKVEFLKLLIWWLTTRAALDFDVLTVPERSAGLLTVQPGTDFSPALLLTTDSALPGQAGSAESAQLARCYLSGARGDWSSRRLQIRRARLVEETRGPGGGGASFHEFLLIEMNLTADARTDQNQTDIPPFFSRLNLSVDSWR